MPFPSIHEIVQSDLFTSETELREKFPSASVERLLRIRAMYNWLISNPETKDKEFVDECISRYHIHKSMAYDDLQILKQVLPHITQASRDYHRWKYNEMILETYAMAKKRKDPSVLGIKPIPNIEEKIRQLIDKYRAESIDIDDKRVTVSVAENHKLFDSQRTKFLKEAKVLSELSDKQDSHIIRVTDLFEENGTAYYVMDYVRGESLGNRLERQNAPLSEDEVLNILRQMLSALHTVHYAGLLHMDIKPANIMVDGKGVCTLIDFGAFKQYALEEQHTLSSLVPYTPRFAPLEQQSQNVDKWGPWTDFYALGATLYNLLTGKLPPKSDELTDNFDTALSMPGVSDKTTRLVKWMMSLSTAKRPKSVAEISGFLDVPEKPSSSPKPKSKLLYWLGGCVVIAVILGFIIISLNGEREEIIDTPGEREEITDTSYPDSAEAVAEEDTPALETEEPVVEEVEEAEEDETKVEDDNQRHMEYKSIVMNKDIDSFASELIEQGFSIVEKSSDAYKMKDNDNEIIYVIFDKQNHNKVMGVCVETDDSINEIGDIIMGAVEGGFAGTYNDIYCDEDYGSITFDYGKIVVGENINKKGTLIFQFIDSVNTQGYKLWFY